MLPQIPPGTEAWAYYLCVGAAVLILGISKAGFGGGIGIAAIPVMAAVMPTPTMLGILLPTLIAADILSNLHHLGHYEGRVLRPLLWGSLPGIVAGSAVLWAMGQTEPKQAQRALSLLVGSICIVFVGVQLWGLAGRRVETRPATPGMGAAVGLLAGFVSTLSHAAGPLVTLFMMRENIEKRRLVGSLVLYFLIVNSLKVPTFVWRELITVETLRDSIWFVPLLPLGTLAGAWMHRKIPEKPFALILYVAAAVTAAKMVWDARG